MTLWSDHTASFFGLCWLFYDTIENGLKKVNWIKHGLSIMLFMSSLIDQFFIMRTGQWQLCKQ